MKVPAGSTSVLHAVSAHDVVVPTVSKMLLRDTPPASAVQSDAGAQVPNAPVPSIVKTQRLPVAGTKDWHVCA